MKSYQDKILDGESATPSEWIAYLKQMHEISPRMTPKAFDAAKTNEGLNSYQLLARELGRVKTRERILDLACGDGHLTKFIREVTGDETKVIGIDMSESALREARLSTRDPRTEFKLAMADATEEPAQSFDAILCHMSLMLMTPLLPVLTEARRLLRPNGLFAGVVGSANLQGFALMYARALSSFTHKEFPKYKPKFAGDPRARTVEGIREFLAEAQLTEIHVKEFNITIAGQPETIGAFFEDMYNVTLLAADMRARFISGIIEMARAECAGGETMSFDFPMILYSSKRPE